MTKAELQVKISELEATLKTNESAQIKLTSDLLKTQRQLENINKPKITQETVDSMYESIEDTIENFDFDNIDLYEVDFNIDYDNKLTLENIRFDNVSELANAVHDHVLKFFNVIEERND